jgi:hypothetical protein
MVVDAMDLKTFVTVTLNQVIQGVREAQAQEHGDSINAESPGTTGTGGNLISGASYGMFTRVDFDVAVTAETSGGGKGSLSVFGAGVEGGANASQPTQTGSSSVSRSACLMGRGKNAR